MANIPAGILESLVETNHSAIIFPKSLDESFVADWRNRGSANEKEPSEMNIISLRMSTQTAKTFTDLYNGFRLCNDGVQGPLTDMDRAWT